MLVDRDLEYPFRINALWPYAGANKDCCEH